MDEEEWDSRPKVMYGEFTWSEDKFSDFTSLGQKNHLTKKKKKKPNTFNLYEENNLKW